MGFGAAKGFGLRIQCWFRHGGFINAGLGLQGCIFSAWRSRLKIQNRDIMGYYWSNIGIVENKMETTILYIMGYRMEHGMLQGFSFHDRVQIAQLRFVFFGL